MTEEESVRLESGKGRRKAGRYSRLKEKGFFRYMGRSVLLILVGYCFLVLLLVILNKYLLDFNALFVRIIDSLSDRFVILLFLVSESFTGMIPVDLFVLWTQKFEQPLPFLFLLGALSYTGGVISYGIGRWISQRPRIKAAIERKLEVYINFTQKWGGAFIVIAAIFPFTPFSLVVIALSMLNFPFRYFLVFALARLVRFVIQGVFFFDLLKLGAWFP